jgi:sarcosine oxidase subunit gamma
MAEVRGRDLVQVAGWPGRFLPVLSKAAALVGCVPPLDTRTAAGDGKIVLFRIGPERLWIAAPVARAVGPRLREALPAEDAAVTELGQSRVVLRLSGALAPALLASAVAVDLDPALFPVGSFAQTGMHQVGVLLHRAGAAAFDLYLPRSYAQSLTEWVAEAAALVR